MSASRRYSHDLICGQGHGGPKVMIMANFKVYFLHWYAGNQKTNYDTPRKYQNFSPAFYIPARGDPVANFVTIFSS